MENNVENEIIQDDNYSNNKDIEKNYYSKSMYKRFLKLKRKGLDYGITVPDLNYALDTPTTPRLAFKITTFVMLALSILVFSLSIYFWVKCGVFTMLGELISGTKSVFTEQAFADSLGLSGIASVATIWLYLLCGLLILIPALVVISLLLVSRKNWILSQISRQEMAKGYEIHRYIITLFVLLGVTLLLLIVLLTASSLSVLATRVMFIIGLVAFFYLISNIVILKLEKQKDEIWFSELNVEKQQDFLNQNEIMKKVLNKK